MSEMVLAKTFNILNTCYSRYIRQLLIVTSVYHGYIKDSILFSATQRKLFLGKILLIRKCHVVQ